MESKVLFEYKRRNDAGSVVSGITVFDQPDNNVMCYPGNPSKTPDGMPYIRLYTLEESVLSQIRDTINENEGVSDIGEYSNETFESIKKILVENGVKKEYFRLK